MTNSHLKYLLAAIVGITGGLVAGSPSSAETMEKAVQTENALNAVESRRTRLPSAEQQGKSAAEAEMTRKIREALMNDPSLSMAAKNITVITRGQTVTLRGRLASAAERQRVQQIAQEQAGTHNVVNSTRLR